MASDNRKHGPVHIVGSSVNIPDMTASLKAKVTVSDEHQADPARLASVYDNMAQKFAINGLDLDAVDAMRQYFDVSGSEPPQPLAYQDFPSPLPPGAVRLALMFMQRSCNELSSLLRSAAGEVAAALPSGTPMHLNDPSHYHVTVFMTSQPHTVRPNPFDPDWVLPTELPPSEWAAPEPAVLEREQAVMLETAAAHHAPTFAVHRLFMADSGTLLLTSIEHGTQLVSVRRALRAAFPGAPPRQSTIVHSSIGRILGSEQLPQNYIDAIVEVCDRWSTRLRGRPWVPAGMSHVQEEVFTTVQGPEYFLPFKNTTADD